MKGRMIKEMMRMNTTEIKLEAKLVGDIQGFFFVPSYQRGYRWGDAEVIRLLDDIYATEGKRNYCLQPVVVRKNGDRFELVMRMRSRICSLLCRRKHNGLPTLICHI